MAWEDSKGRYVRGENYRLGKWVVGGWHHDATLPRGASDTYAVTCALPGIRAELGHRETAEAARALLEAAVQQWVAGLTADVTPSK